jgi:hypothetical protein
MLHLRSLKELKKRSKGTKEELNAVNISQAIAGLDFN